MKKRINGKLKQLKYIVSEIEQAAQLYKQIFVGKKYLFVFDGRFIEVVFREDAFKHLVGVESTLPARRFYDLAIEHQLEAAQFYFSSRHPLDTYKKKMKHLKKLSQIFEKQCYMLQDIHTNTASFSFGTTEGEFTLCFGKDKHHNPEYIIQSLRNGDASKKAADKFIVTHILAKPNNQMLYSEMVYTTAEQLPDIVEEKITPHIKDALM